MKSSIVKTIFFFSAFFAFCTFSPARNPYKRELNAVFGDVKKVTQQNADKTHWGIEVWNYNCQGNLTEHNIDGEYSFDYVYLMNGENVNTLKYKTGSSIDSSPFPLYLNPVVVGGWEIYTLQHDSFDIYNKKAERNGLNLSEVAFAGEAAFNGGKRVWNKTFIYDKYNRLTELRTIDGNNLRAARTLFTFDGNFPHPVTKTDEFEYVPRYRETYKYVLDGQKNWIEQAIVSEQLEDEKFVKQSEYKLKRKIDYFEAKECRQSKAD